MIAIERAVYLSFAFDCGIPPVEHYSLQDLLPIHSIYIYIYIFIYYHVKHRTLVPASSFNGLEEYELTSVYLTELEKTSQKKNKKNGDERLRIAYVHLLPSFCFLHTKDIISRQDVFHLPTYYL